MFGASPRLDRVDRDPLTRYGQMLRRVVAEHCSVFHGLVDRSSSYLTVGRHDAAAVYAQIAANFAMSQHPGLFASPTLERILLTIGHMLSPNPSQLPRRGRTASPRHVLHVLTRAFGIGGDARMVWRWIEADADRTHSVVLTRQGAVPVPAALRHAVDRNGGRITVLNRSPGGLGAWAGHLRRIAATADVVVLHVHPYDVIPVLAFARRADGPAVIYADHADHAFWVGTSVSDVVASLRKSGARLAATRRGVPTDRSALLPIPLRPPRRTLSREQAKAQLGLGPETVLLLSIARPHKYDTVDGVSFPEAHLPLLEANPEAVLLVVGPDDAGPWAIARERSRGRIRAMGMRDDTAVFYQAADVYVDSFPIVSITSLLEAGSYGVPLVSRCLDRQVASVLCADTPGLAAHLVRAPDLAAYHAVLTHLMSDAAFRHDLGEQTRQGILDHHAGDGWLRSLRATYELAARVSQIAEVPDQVESPRDEELDLWLPLLFHGEPDLDWILQFHLRLMPLDLRVSQWIDARRAGRRPGPGLLLPEWLGTSLEWLRWRGLQVLK